ncbi:MULTISPECIES: type I polyketide synthase [unclassified Micromonospora]|uniref:type I polyketide synthase n=1 Tax=unclassified Micromonospora TaxID=2617518 RepID=UPI00362912D5
MVDPSALSKRPDTVPIAIIGMGCRFAGGVNSPEDFWKLLVDGRDAISEVPPDRWAAYLEASTENAAALQKTTRFGAFLDDISGFDADFFGITPREAELMDPQQRIMLEVAWEALEHAGIVPDHLAGSDTGVFVGVGSDDYGRRLLEDLPGIEAWTGIGAAMCAVANRVSYSLDLRGPSFAVDTACSASLVATHLACQALATGETSLALVGGVNIMAGPGLTMVLDAAGAISPDGRCKSFDAAANGYGRGEGCGAVVLKRLADAERDGDRVLAVIQGSAVHQDGRTNGIMAPSGEAQADLLRHAYQVSGIDPGTVDYVEAHGTGTRAGDPIEAGAMAEVFGAGRAADAPCLIGSVKPNIGHLEAGSGVAGVIKAVLALRHGEIPPSLNFSEPNPAIPWATSGLRVVAELAKWPVTDHPRRAGVSGYGYGGTIAHVVLEEAPESASVPSDVATTDQFPAPRLYPISAATEAGLRAHAARLTDLLTGTDTPGLDAIGHTLAARRAQLGQRAVVVATDRIDLANQLGCLAGDGDGTVATGSPVAGAAAGAVWVFSGHGSQWPGMGRELIRDEPAFAAVLDEIGPIFAEEIGFTPRDVLLDGPLETVDVIQPMIFAMQVGLAAVWRERGLEPAAVIGHSVGEIAASVTAGSLDLADGARLICRRSILLRRVAGQGAMAMVDLPFAEVAQQLADRTDVAAAIAASFTATVVAGTAAAVDELSAGWTQAGRVVRRVASDVAFHSGQMDPLLDELAASVADLSPRPARLPIYTTALADPRATPVHDGAYWAANLRNPVRLATAVQAAAEDGYRVFLEVSSHPVVAHSVSEVLADSGVEEAFVTGTLRRNQSEQQALLAALAALYCHGVPLDLAAQFSARELADLPTTAWQQRPFWRDGSARKGHQVRQHDVQSHTLLGGLTTVAGTTSLRLWQTYLDEDCRPYPGDHPVQGVEIIPAAVLLNTFFTAASTATGAQRAALAGVHLRVPVSVAAPRDLQVSAQDNTLRLASRLAGEDDSWLVHTTATIDRTADPVASVLDPDQARLRCAVQLPETFVIDRLASIGVAAMGFPWRIEELRWSPGKELFARISAGEQAPSSWACVLDAALSAASVVFDGPAALRMPAGIERVAVRGDSPGCVLLSVQTTDAPGADTVDVVIATPDGEVVAELTNLRYGRLDGDPGATASPRRLVHELTWRCLEQDAAPTGTLDRVLVVGGEDPVGSALTDALTSAGIPHRLVTGPGELDACRADLTSASAVLVATSHLDGAALPQTAARAAWLLGATAARLATWPDGPRLWAVTAGVRDSVSESAVGQSSVWGIGRIIAGEHPALWGGLVDLDETDLRGAAGMLPNLLRSRPHEDVIALSRGGALCTRLVLVDRQPDRSPVGCRPDGTYLITGGLGVLGLEIAGWLAGQGARRIVLVGRRGLPPRAEWDDVVDPTTREQISAVRSLEALGVAMVVVAADISDRRNAPAAIEAATRLLPPIRGVVHAAGVLDNRMLVDLDQESLRTVLRPKVDGAVVLHEMFPPGSLDFLVYFSSCGYLLGLPGQASYGAANAFLDSLAAHRQADGARDTVSLGWTSWRGLGMSTSSQLIDLELNARGTADITATEAFRSWEHADRYRGAHFAVFRPVPMEAGLPRIPLLAEISVDDTDTGAAMDDPGWNELPAEELQAHVVGEVSRHVCAELRMPTDQLDVRRPLAEMGVDSVMTLVMRRQLEKSFRLTLPATLLWNHPTVAAIADYIAGQLTGEQQDHAARVPDLELA